MISIQMKRVILCADDYGQNSAISQAIIELLQKNRLTAVSCMTTSQTWHTAAQSLMPFKSQADIGLHFNLTEDMKIAQPLPALIVKAFLRQLDTRAIEAELNHQIDSFVNGIGRLPDFIDGHQHIHQLPQIRDIVLAVYEKRLRPHRSYIRSTHMPQFYLKYAEPAYFKKIIIELCGAYTFRQQLDEYHIPHNTSFSGVYDFSPDKPYGDFFVQFLNQLKNGGLIMCHPGSPAEIIASDKISAARANEFNYFASDKFLEDCKREQVELARFQYRH